MKLYITTGWYSDAANLAARFPDASGGFNVQNSGGTVNYMISGASQSGTVFPTGNVGIGTVSPSASYKLIVNGGFTNITYNAQTVPASGEGLVIGWNRSNSQAEVNLYNAYNNAPTAFQFSQKTATSTYTDLMTIRGNGNVGIGYLYPGAQLHIGRIITSPDVGIATKTYDVSTVGEGFLINSYMNTSESYTRCTDILALGAQSGTNGGGMIKFMTNSYTSNTAVEAMRIQPNSRVRIATWTADGTTVVYKNASGDIGIVSSDIRLKKNIVPIQNSLDIVKGITGVLYNLNSDSANAKKSVGVIAQDVMKVLPELTFAFKNPDGETYYSVHYEKLGAVLINAVKDQQKQIEQLQKENEELKTQNLSFNTKFESQQAEIEKIKLQLELNTEAKK